MLERLNGVWRVAHKMVIREKHRMEVVCAYCKKHMSFKKCYMPGKISHGICEPCMKVHFPEAWKKLYGGEG